MVVRLPEMKKYLNRDGLEEYNSLLPHSSTEIEEYVADWLDAHPEATTTVQDGSITTQKLADASVTRNKLAADVAHLLGGMMVTGEVQGEILSADDAYSVAPLSMTIDGKSTQNGTPTPDSPVPIQSVEVLELPVNFEGKNLLDTTVWVENKYIGPSGQTGSENGQHYTENYSAVLPGTYCLSMLRGTGGRIRLHGYDGSKHWVRQLKAESLDGGSSYYSTALTIPDGIAYVRLSSTAAITNQQLELGSTRTDYEPFTGGLITANIHMQGHVLRSLPDGTHDTMTLSYLRESDRTGWAWYSRELVQAVDEIKINSFSSVGTNMSSQCVTFANIGSRFVDVYTAAGATLRGASNRFTPQQSSGNYVTNGHFVYYAGNGLITFAFANGRFANVAEANAWLAENQTYVHLKLRTPITTQLDPIELPILPAPTCTVWSDPATGLKMSYMRDANIVISDIEQAIADQ